MGIAILIFRRMPALLAFYKIIPEIKTYKEAVFMGYFGPIGVGALFYNGLAIQELTTSNEPQAAWLVEITPPVVYFLVLCSIIIHGITIPMALLGFNLPSSIGTISQTISQSRSRSTSRVPSRDREPRFDFSVYQTNNNVQLVDSSVGGPSSAAEGCSAELSVAKFENIDLSEIAISLKRTPSPKISETALHGSSKISFSV